MAASAGSGYVLGMDRAIEDGAAVWIHSREDGTGGLKVSTQFMYVDSSVLAGYQTSAAMAGAANSYGGINAQAVYLQPRSGVGRVGGGVVPVVPAGEIPQAATKTKTKTKTVAVVRILLWGMKGNLAYRLRLTAYR